jgi:hypothetical protein
MKHFGNNVSGHLGSTNSHRLLKIILTGSLWLGLGQIGHSGTAVAAEKTTQKPVPVQTTPRPAAPAAQPTPPPPAELANWVKQLDEAASRKDITATLKFYSPSFAHQDGLTYQTWEQNLQNTWKTLQTVQYQTQINQWKAEPGNRYTVETRDES